MQSTRRARARVVAAVAAAVCGVGLVPATGAQAATPGCTLASTNGTITRKLGSRYYQLHVPSGLTGTQVPLLLSLHGAGSNGLEDEYFTGWSTYADARNFIVAYPDAQGYPIGVWDPYSEPNADVEFLRSVVADISSTWCIDPQRIYVDGWSNGAVMAQRVACDAPDLFAAATSYGGGDPTASGIAAACRPSRPISVGLIVGQEDFTYAGLAMDTSLWQGVDDCSATGTQARDQYGTNTFYGCGAGATLWTRVVDNTSHNWPSGVQGENQRNQMWAFDLAHPMP